MSDLNKKTQLNNTDDVESFDNGGETKIDVEKYIHVDDDKNIGLDIFKDSSDSRSGGKISDPSSDMSKYDSLNISNSLKKKLFGKNKAHKDSRVKIIVFSIVAFVLITAIGLGAVIHVSNKRNNSISVNFRYSTQNKDVGTVRNIIKRDVKYAYGIYYPHFGKETIDKTIERQNDEIISGFLSKYKSYISSDSGSGVVMFSDYSATDFADYYQIVRKTEYRISEDKTVEHVIGMFYDVRNDKILKGSDFFDSTFRQIISVKASDYLRDNTNMKKDYIEEITDNKKMKLDNFSIDSQNLYLYFDDPSGVTTTISFPLELSITGHFRISYTTLRDNYNMAHKTDAS